MGKRINAPQNMKRKKKAKKLKGNQKIKHLVREIENAQWNDKTLSESTKIKSIIAMLTTFDRKHPNNSIVEHALVKWNDKLNR